MINMNTQSLEAYYETAILPLYRDTVVFERIAWKDHGKIGEDAWAHYFDDQNGVEYVVVYEDFPGATYLDDQLSHDVVLCKGEPSVRVATVPDSSVDNVVGCFTLYRERS